jgi:CheY-like chemotaxis protein
MRDHFLCLRHGQMPVCDGYETTKRLRQTPGRNQNTIIVVLTGMRSLG